ncbi:MAG: AmmeMemoRadiSam system protein A [Candidatus Gracilibacteria bacterium]|nr:AmmeMemoRadiSam system protein A [Candidatus Gracilibacteria bacterium]
MKNYQIEALQIAKKSILEEFGKYSLKGYKILNKELLEKKACFVTLKSFQKDLRGCIGNIFPVGNLYNSIISNAKNSAFSDPRFSPLTFEELENNDIFVEITILGEIQEKYFLSIQELLKFLKENKPGLIIQLGFREATFLPSVWHEIKSEEDFLTHLIYKAGIEIDEFINNFSKVKISIYSGEEFGNKISEI